MRKKIIYILSFFMLALTVKVSAQNELNRYLETAADNNPGLKVKFNEYMAALEKVPQAGALPDPTVAFGYFIKPVETRVGPQQAKISVSQMLPWFGTLSSRENSVESIAMAKYQLFEEAKSKLFYDVKSSYFNLYFIQQAIDITIENIEILTSFKNLANIKVESGSASSIDAYRVQIEINDLEYQLALLKDNKQLLTVKFNSLLNVDEDANILVDNTLPAGLLIDKHNSLDSVLSNNNRLTSFDYQLEGLQHQQNVATKEGLPQFNIGLDYTFIGTGVSTATNAGQDAFMFPKVGITVPLYRKKYKAKVQEVIYLQEAKTNEKRVNENALKVLFESVWRDYQDALRRTSLFREQESLAKMSLSVLESEYATSSLNFEEILRMERKLLKYALELKKAEADKAAALAFIDYLKGN